MNDKREQRDDGGPAFPKPAVDLGTTFECGQNGMSLRDWFAGQQAAAIRAGDPSFTISAESLASTAYMDADAMLKARASRDRGGAR